MEKLNLISNLQSTSYSSDQFGNDQTMNWLFLINKSDNQPSYFVKETIAIQIEFAEGKFKVQNIVENGFHFPLMPSEKSGLNNFNLQDYKCSQEYYHTILSGVARRIAKIYLHHQFN
jgi:hypothetical protein